MAIDKKNDSTTPVDRSGLGFSLTAANQSLIPVVYTDDVWEIVESGTAISNVISGVTEDPNPSGTYTALDVIDAIATKIVEINETVDEMIGGGSGSISQQIDAKINELNASKEAQSNGITVSITEEKGKITTFTISAPNFQQLYEVKGSAETVKNELIGTSGDTESATTINGAKKYTDAALVTAKQYADDKVNALDSTKTSTNNGVTVSITQENGVVSALTVTSTLIGTSGDTASADTIYGAKKASSDVLGTSGDTSSTKTVYGAIALATEANNKVDNIATISDTDINRLFLFP